MSTSIMSYPSHGIAVLSLGLPLIGGHLGQVAIGVTDTVMLGWYGVDELAAQTVAGSFFLVLFLAGAGFAWAVMPMVASYDAEGDEVSLRRATRMGLWLSVGFAITVMPLMYWSEEILLFGCKTNIFKLDFPLIASIAAAPVSPEVATITFIFLFFLLR